MRHSALWRAIASLLHFRDDPIHKISWMEEWHNKKGFRRVTPTRYALSIDTLLLEAAKRETSVLILTPCNMAMASEKKIDGGYPWDIYFQILEEVAERRATPIVHGMMVAYARKKER